MTNDNLDIERLNRFFKGNFSEGDREYLRKLFCDENKEEELEHFLKKQWYELLKNDQAEDKNLEHVLYRIHYELNTKNNQLKRKGILKNMIIWSSRIAAILILPMIIYTGILFNRKNDKNNLTWIELNAPAWTRVKFSLPDGSTGWLNSSSCIRYQSDFIRDRKLMLNGEAFFNVRSNPDKPFVVNTREINVTALGTRFNIASYENEKDVEIVLEEGKLLFNNAEQTTPVEMVPNDLVIYNKATNQLLREVIQPQIYLSWTEGKLVFRNDPIDVVARRLGRWYNVDVEVGGNNYEEVRLRATFIDENLEEVLYFLSRALPVDYKIITGGMDTDDETFVKKRIIFTLKNRNTTQIYQPNKQVPMKTDQ